MAERLNGPGFGARMAMAQQAQKPVSGASVVVAVTEVGRIAAELQDQLRELLSYCTVKGTTDDPHDYVAEAYADVAARLRSMLDGEQ